MSKQDILARIKDSLHINPLDAQSPHYINPLNIEQKDELQAYIALQSANKAIVVESCPNTLVQDIHKALQEVKAQKILYNPNIADVLDINALCNTNGINIKHICDIWIMKKALMRQEGNFLIWILRLFVQIVAWQILVSLVLLHAQMLRASLHLSHEIVLFYSKKQILWRIFMMACAPLKPKVKMECCQAI